MPTPDEPVDEAALVAALEKEQAAQAENWGKYICGPTPIYINGARAFNPGDPVPASHVTDGVVEAEQVTEAHPEQEPASADPGPSNSAEMGN